MKRKTRKIFLTVVLVFMLCISQSSCYAWYHEDKLTPTINKLAFEMLRDEKISQMGENVLFSPYSFLNPMVALYLGTEGTTRAEFEGAFGFDSWTTTEIKNLRKNLVPAMTKSDWADVGRIFASKKEKVHLLQSFKDYMAHFLQMDITLLDFSKPDAASGEINSWVAGATKGMIKQLLKKGDITPDTGLVLVDAIHFKAPWQNKFSAKDTRELYFHDARGGKQKLPFLTKSFDKLDYYEDDALSCVSIPYEGEGTDFMIILPKQKEKKAQTLEELLPSLTEKKFATICGALRACEVQLAFPRFKAETRSDLTSFTSRLSPSATNPALADFSNMTGKRDYYIGQVIQQATVDVTEEGTEASAATSVQMVAMCAPSKTKKIFTADRPFIYLIYNVKTKTILFIGKFEKGE